MKRTLLALVPAARQALPLLWQGRLSWLRIALVVLFGERAYRTIRSWQDVAPEPLHEGWLLSLLPQGLQDLLLGHPAVAVVLALAMVLSVIGLFTRPALLVVAALGTLAFAVEAGQGVFDHEASLAAQVLFVLALCPGTDAVSVDAAIRRRRADRGGPRTWRIAPHRQWGLTVILLLLAVTYTTSGLSKLRFGGISWLNGETLGFYLRGLTSGSRVYVIGGGAPTWRDDLGLEMYTYANAAYGRYPSAVLAGVAEWLAHTPAALAALSVATVALELAGFVLLVPRLRSAFLIAAILMHTTIGMLMGLDFTMYRLVCFFLIEWELLGVLAARRRARRASPDADPVRPSPVPAELPAVLPSALPADAERRP